MQLNKQDFQWYYVIDPMCSWCYAFAPEFKKIISEFPFKVNYIMGGLAADSNEPMSKQMAMQIASYWKVIEQKTQVRFNHDFWQLNTPIRSTYPSCRAVISAELMQANYSSKMIEAIQAAYYQEAKNPSLLDTLVDCAEKIGLDRQIFLEKMKSCDAEEKLDLDFIIKEKLGANGFPSLYLVYDNKSYPISYGYQSFENLKHIITTTVNKLNESVIN